MEARLFFISIWCGVYGQLLRGVFRKSAWATQLWVTLIFNSIFWGTVGVIVGMLKASYMTGVEYQIQYSIPFVIAGVVYGAVMAGLHGYAKKIFNVVFWAAVGVYFGFSMAQGLEGIQLILRAVIGCAVFGYFAWTNVRHDEGREGVMKDNLEWADTGFSAILLASIVMFFVVQAFKIPSGSMRMTFVEGDHLFVNKFIYGVPVPFTQKKVLPFTKVKSGDIVIFRFPSDDKENQHYGKDFIKRVVAIEGQKVEIKNKVLFVDGQKQEEKFKQHVDPHTFNRSYQMKLKEYQDQWQTGEFPAFAGNDLRDNFGPITVPDNHVLVLGDNRDRSYDSRFWGPLPMKAIKGKAWLLYWPLNRFRLVKHQPQ